jgi:alkylation response protein AidB-like acyl-CoA dehydrogenase
VLDRLVDLGLSGALVGTEHGGLGFGVADLVPTWRALSQGWISLTGAVNPTALASTLLARNGSPAQQERWLPGIARGELLASFSITEPQAGSDLKRLETTARRRDGGGLVLDGEKRWIAGGASSDVIFLMAEVEGSEKPSCVILPSDGRDTPTWEVGDLDKVGYRGVESATYRFTGHEAPGAEVLGGDDGLGKGARMMLGALDVGRVNVACRALGILDRCLRRPWREATERGSATASSATTATRSCGWGDDRRRDGVEALIDRAAAAVDAGSEEARELSTAAKVFASDTAVWAVDRAARLPQPLLRRRRRARPPAPRRAADPDRRGRQRRAAHRAGPAVLDAASSPSA